MMTIGQFLILVAVVLFSGALHFFVAQKLFRKVHGKWNGQIAVHFVGEPDDTYHHYGRHGAKLPDSAVIESIIFCGAHAGSMPNICHVSLFEQRHTFLPYEIRNRKLGSIMTFREPISRPDPINKCSFEMFIVGAEKSGDDLGGYFTLYWNPISVPALV